MSAPAPSAGPRTGFALTLVFLTIFIDFLGIGILQPVGPFLVEKYRADATALGWIASAYAIAQFLAAPTIGAISDRVGRRPTLLVSLVGSSVGYLLFAIAPNFTFMIVARVVEGITGGAISTAQAYIADVTDPKDRAKSFGLIGVAVGLGFVFGPGIGGWLAQFDIHAPVYFIAGLAALNAAFAFFFVPESLTEPSREPLTFRDANPVTRLLAVFRDKRVRLLAWTFFIFNLGFSGFTGIFAKFLKERFDYGPVEAGRILFVVGLVILLVQGGLIRVLVRKLGEFALGVAGLTVSAVAFQIVPFVRDGDYLYVTQGMLAFGVALASPSIRALISNSVQRTEQGRIIGSTQGLLSLSLILGPLMAGLVFDRISWDAPFILAGILFAGSLACLVAAKPSLAGPSASVPEPVRPATDAAGSAP